MIEINDYAYQNLFETLTSYLHLSSDFGSPPIFYWYCKVIDETRNIDSYRNLRRGQFKYRLGNSLGIAHVQCDYVGRTRVLIITDYEINTRALFTWKRSTQNGGFISTIASKPRKPYRRLTTKPLFGYSFVMNDRKEYNLIDKDGKLVTHWFSAIRPFQQPYGKYQLIAYINVGGQFCALGYDGKVYSLGKNWQEMYTENRDIFTTELFMNIITEQIEDTMKTNKKVVRLTESDLHRLIEEAVRETLNEIGDTAKGQYMLGRVQGRQQNQGNANAALSTRDYAIKQHCNAFPNAYKWGNPQKQSADDCEVARHIGYRDEVNPELSKSILNTNNNQSTYDYNIRKNNIGKYSKF